MSRSAEHDAVTRTKTSMQLQLSLNAIFLPFNGKQRYTVR